MFKKNSFHLLYAINKTRGMLKMPIHLWGLKTGIFISKCVLNEKNESL